MIGWGAVTSMMRPRTYGPRSLTRTTVLLPLSRFVMRTRQGSGRVLCAAPVVQPGRRAEAGVRQLALERRVVERGDAEVVGPGLAVDVVGERHRRRAVRAADRLQHDAPAVLAADTMSVVPAGCAGKAHVGASTLSTANTLAPSPSVRVDAVVVAIDTLDAIFGDRFDAD